MEALGKLMEGDSIFSSPLVVAFWGACVLLGSCFLPALIWHGRTAGTRCRPDEPFEGDGKLLNPACTFLLLLATCVPRQQQCSLALLLLLWWVPGAAVCYVVWCRVIESFLFEHVRGWMAM